MSFQTFAFHPGVAAGITTAGYATPTPIQNQTIPPIMAGRDVMGLAQTGTGKTAAFALPILHRLMTAEKGKVKALIVAPTRELAEQIHQSIQLLGGNTRLRSVTVYGGVKINPQIEKIRRGAEIVVACPGRLLDHISQGTINLSHLEFLVLDEADQMFDMGFLPDIRRLLRHVPAKRQTLLFSATMPADIRKLASEILTDPVTAQAGSPGTAVTVSHALYPVAQHLKTPLLLEMMRRTDTDSVLVFTKTKHRAKRVGEQLEKAGFRAASLQGNLSQNRRQAALDGFRDGTFQILVATDIAARGIDVSQVSHVINYDMPDTAEAYTHRIGRTGRAARTGDAYTMSTSDDAVMIRTIERLLKTPLERRAIEGFDYSAPAPQRDTEFARPPRAARPARKPAAKNQSAAGASRPAKGRQHHANGASTSAAAPMKTGRQSR